MRKSSLERPASAILLVLLCSSLTHYASAAPVQDDAENQEVYYINDEAGCYYNFQHYAEGDRIVTNEPCLNCTCHNRMLMCYLRVCPFTKAIGQDCTVEKHPDQCCPVISCPEVPVKLLTSTTEQPTTTSALGAHDNYGCTIRNSFFADGVQVPSDPRKPCELCYCIRNRTACVMQECTLHVEGCRPVYQPGVCCPVRYECDYEDKESLSAPYPFNGTSVLTTATPSLDCKYGDDVFADGESIATDKPCEHCYCMRGDIVCAVQDCGEPLRGKDCTPLPVPPGQCCPASYTCANETVSYQDPDQSNDIITQVQGIINSIKDDTRPDMMENTAEIINPEEVMAPAVSPSDESEVENNENNYVSSSDTENIEAIPGTLHDNIDVDSGASNVKDSEKPVVASDAVKPDTVQDTHVEEHASQDLSTSAPTNELDSTIGVSDNNNQDPQEDPSKVSSTSVNNEVSSSPQPIFEIKESSPASISVDNSHYEEPAEVVTTSPEVESPSHVAPANSESSPDVNMDSTGSNEGIQTTSVPAIGASISDTSAPDQSYVEVGATESVIKDNVHDSVPVKKPEEELAPVADVTLPVDSSSSNPAVQDNAVVETKDPAAAVTESSISNQETSSINIVAQDKIDTQLSTSAKPVVTETSHEPSHVHHDEIHLDPIHDDEDGTYLKPNEVSEPDETLPEVNVADMEGHGIPGEGNCLIDGKTYTNTSIIPTSNPCHVKCECISSIPSCTLVNCPPPPPQHKKCEPIQPGRDSCCPTYACAEEDTSALEAHNQVSSEPQQSTSSSDLTGPASDLDSSTSGSNNEHAETNILSTPASIPASDSFSQPDHETILKPAETPESGQVEESKPAMNAAVDHTATKDTTEVPESDESIITTLSPSIEKIPSHIKVPDMILSPENSGLSSDTGISSDPQTEAPAAAILTEQPISVDSANSPAQDVDKPSYTNVPTQEITTSSFNEYGTSAPESVPAEEVATSTKKAVQDEVNIPSEQYISEVTVSSSSSPEISHDDSESAPDVDEKDPEMVSTGNDQPPSLDTQQSNEPVSSSAADGIVGSQAPLGTVEKDTTVTHDAPSKEPQTFDVPAETTYSPEDQSGPGVGTEESNIVTTQQPDSIVSSVVGDSVENGPAQKVTDVPAAGDFSVGIKDSQTDVPAISGVPPKTDNLPQSAPEYSSDTVVTTAYPEEIPTTILDDNSKPLTESSSAHPIAPNIPELTSPDVVGVPHDSSSQAEVHASENLDQASPAIETIYHDEHVSVNKPESDSSIYLPASVPENENGIAHLSPVSPTATQEDAELAQSSADNAPVNNMSPPTAHLPESETAHHPVSDFNVITSDPSSHQNKDGDVLKDPQANIEATHGSTQSLIHDSEVVSSSSEPPSSALDQHLDSPSAVPALSQTNEHAGDGNLNEETLNPHIHVGEEPVKSSTEINYYDTGSDTDSTVAPLGVPGEVVAGETVGPVIVHGTEDHHEDMEGGSVTVSYPQTVEPELSSSTKPSDAPQESQDGVTGPIQSTEVPASISEITDVAIADDLPPEKVQQTLANKDGTLQSPIPSLNEKEPETELVEQTTLAGLSDPEKISEDNSSVQPALLDTSEAQEIPAPSMVDVPSISEVLQPQVPENHVSPQGVDSVSIAEDEVTYLTGAPVISTDRPLGSLDGIVKPVMAENSFPSHEQSETSNSDGTSANLGVSHSSETDLHQDHISSTTQQNDGAVSPGSVSNTDILGASVIATPENIPHHEPHYPIGELPENEIKDSSVITEVHAQTITEATDKLESSIQHEINKDPSSVISSQGNDISQTDLSNPEHSEPQHNDPSLNGESSLKPSVTLASTASYPPVSSLESSSLPDSGSLSQDTHSSSSEPPVPSPVAPADYDSHGTVSEVSSPDLNVVPAQTEPPSEPEIESTAPQGPVETPEEISHSSQPAVFEDNSSVSLSGKPSHTPSQADLLTSIIQGHLGDPNKPLGGYGSEIDSQLAELINKVSTPASITNGSNSTPSDTILHSSWTPKPMPTEDSSHRPGEDESFPTDSEYEEDEEGSFGPGTCKYLGKLYVSAQQIPRDDPCDFCFCFRSDIICLQQSCPPPIFGCRQETIQGFCCPRYECPVSKALEFNSSSTSTSTTTLPPVLRSFSTISTQNVVRAGCDIQGRAYRVGENITEASNPCRTCKCLTDGKMSCIPEQCSPVPTLTKMIEIAAEKQLR